MSASYSVCLPVFMFVFVIFVCSCSCFHVFVFSRVACVCVRAREKKLPGIFYFQGDFTSPHLRAALL